MQYRLTAPSQINANINLPASKSISNRALIINALAGGGINLQNLSDCDDTQVIINALRDMPEVINIGAGGTAMRFMTAYLSVTEGEHTITGTERMRHRPIGELVDALRYLGADIKYEGEEGFPPIRVKGAPLEGGILEIPGNISSQYISALLMIAPALRNGLELKLTENIVSRPYIDLTLCTMKDCGADAEWTEIDTITVKPKPYSRKDFLIENDWSASSYWYEMLAINGNQDSVVELNGLMDGSRQGDSVVRYLFSLFGIKTSFVSDGLNALSKVRLTSGPRNLPRIDYDFVNQPDLAQTLIVTCALKGIKFRFTGLGNLKIKETDRIEALKKEMRKLGYVIRDNDGKELYWEGETCDATMEAIDTYEDHRIAMAFAPAAIKFPGLRINNPEVVSKSYPHYWNDLRNAGFRIEETE